jgi:SAM-dependent methyltransferase
MLNWYRDQLRQFGLITATVLLVRVASSRIAVDLSNRFLKPTVSCPCCGWSGRKFYDYIEVAYTGLNAACPQCDSHPRHRRFFLWLTNDYGLKNKSGVGVVFAPERSLNTLWQSSNALRIFRADFEPTKSVDMLLDVQRLPLTGDTIDFLWCHHVLEHIEDDEAAMRELNRILRPGTGELVVSVPMNGARETKEYGFADPKESGHWRIYGDDFVNKLAATGFDVSRVAFELSADDAARFGIVEEPFYICRKPLTIDSRS